MNRNINYDNQYIEAYHTLQKEYMRSVLAHYKKKDEDEAWHHAWEGAIKVMDSVYIARAIEILRPKNILEVGSYIGFSTALAARKHPKLVSSYHIHRPEYSPPHISKTT